MCESLYSIKFIRYGSLFHSSDLTFLVCQNLNLFLVGEVPGRGHVVVLVWSL